MVFLHHLGVRRLAPCHLEDESLGDKAPATAVQHPFSRLPIGRDSPWLVGCRLFMADGSLPLGFGCGRVIFFLFRAGGRLFYSSLDAFDWRQAINRDGG